MAKCALYSGQSYHSLAITHTKNCLCFLHFSILIARLAGMLVRETICFTKPLKQLVINAQRRSRGIIYK